MGYQNLWKFVLTQSQTWDRCGIPHSGDISNIQLTLAKCGTPILTGATAGVVRIQIQITQINGILETHQIQEIPARGTLGALDIHGDSLQMELTNGITHGTQETTTGDNPGAAMIIVGTMVVGCRAGTQEVMIRDGALEIMGSTEGKDRQLPLAV